MNPAILLGLGLLIYMVTLQFRERAVRFPTLLIMPALLLYYSYTNVTAQLANPQANPLLIGMGLVIGLLLGCVVGWYRGEQAYMRLDSVKGMVFAKASAVSLVIWFIFLVLKVATTVVLYMGLAHTSMLLALVIAAMTALFLGNVLAERICLLQRGLQYQVVYRNQQQLR